jgi:4-hydroxybenzoate polyprenyltransferase
MPPFIAVLRPLAWIKNFFIFAPLFFARDAFDGGRLGMVVVAFIVFSLTASAVYIFNDIIDQGHDRQHEKKKLRPIASGALSVENALTILGILLIAALGLGFIFVPKILPLVGVYAATNIAYSLYLKRIATIDIIVVALLYLIRISIGGIAAGVPVSAWLLLCTTFISLFLITGKRVAEFNQKTGREVLNEYTAEFLHGILLVSATLSIISYSLYVVLVLTSSLAVYSVFFVLLGVIRYIYIVFTSHKSEYPERIIISDRIILISGIAWIILMFIIFYR